jgi:hypothetical protein
VAEGTDEDVGDAAAQTGLAECPGEQEGNHNKPDGRIHKTVQGIADRDRVCQRRSHGSNDHHRPHG